MRQEHKATMAFTLKRLLLRYNLLGKYLTPPYMRMIPICIYYILEAQTFQLIYWNG